MDSGSSSSSDMKDSRLDNVISSYSTITRTERRSYQNNRFPEVRFPSGANPSSINTVPSQISSQTAVTSSENRNTITADDVAMRTASERHQNSVKAITNLLKIIDQARANRNFAKSNLEVYAREYNDALSAQRRAQNDIIAAETRRSQITSAIEGAEKKIADYQGQLDDITGQREDLNARKAKLLVKISGEERIKAELMAQLESINADLARLMKELATYKEKAEFIKVKISAAQAELKKAEGELASVIERRLAAEREVADGEAKVDELRRLLQAAEDALAGSKIKLASIIEEEKRIPAIIEGIKTRIAGLVAELDKANAAIARIQAEIDALNPDDLVSQIEDLEESILADRRSVMEIDGELAALVEPEEKLKAMLKGSQDDFAFLKTQILACEEALRQAYSAGNDANTLVAHARQNLDSVNARYQEEEKVISEATLNLERARAEEALARLALEEIISHYSDALPYSIVPNGNGQTPAGTPYGNNPSGSPLGPISQHGNGAPGEFVVKDWTHYLSLAFGRGVHPAFRGSVTKLYPFNFLSIVSGRTIRNEYDEIVHEKPKVQNNGGVCGGNGPVRAASGEVISIGQDGFKVRLDDGQVYDIHVSPCTKMNSNVAGYSMKMGDEAVVKGTQVGYSRMNASQVTCLSE